MNISDPSLDSLAMLAIGSGIPIISGAIDKWHLIIGGVLVILGAGLSILKYYLRDKTAVDNVTAS